MAKKKPAKPVTTRKRNPQDTTFRNIDALKHQLRFLQDQIDLDFDRISRLEGLSDRVRVMNAEFGMRLKRLEKMAGLPERTPSTRETLLTPATSEKQ